MTALEAAALLALMAVVALCAAAYLALRWRDR